jgi:hypothetical protein
MGTHNQPSYPSCRRQDTLHRQARRAVDDAPSIPWRVENKRPKSRVGCGVDGNSQAESSRRGAAVEPPRPPQPPQPPQPPTRSALSACAGRPAGEALHTRSEAPAIPPSPMDRRVHTTPAAGRPLQYYIMITL